MEHENTTWKQYQKFAESVKNEIPETQNGMRELMLKMLDRIKFLEMNATQC